MNGFFVSLRCGLGDTVILDTGAGDLSHASGCKTVYLTPNRIGPL
jgi:hypothetical protein